MTRFEVDTTSEATVGAERPRVWAALTDPELLPRLTPFLEQVHADGDRWRWDLQRIPVLSTAVRPSFTETMLFVPERRIEFTHTPSPGTRETAGAEGVYDLTETEQGTHLHIALGIHVDLPLPRISGPAVRQVMRTVVDQMGSRFSANLVRHLGG